jgi:dTDP-glucose 4,6-dehydratase
MDVHFNSAVESSGERPGKDLAYLLDSSNAQNDLGWKPEISLESGIDETIAWVDKNLDELKMQPFDYLHKS